MTLRVGADTFGMKVNLPSGIKVVRHIPPPQVEVPGENVPLIKPEDPDHKQVQQVWHAKVRVFDMAKPEDVEALEAIWQKVCNSQAVVSEHHTNWNSDKQTYVVFIRWSEFSYIAPQA